MQLQQDITQARKRNLEQEHWITEAAAESDKVSKLKHKHHSTSEAHTATALISKQGRHPVTCNTATVQKVSHFGMKQALCLVFVIKVNTLVKM